MSAAPAGGGPPLPLLVLPGMLCDRSLWAEVEFPAGHPVHHLTPAGADLGGCAEQALAALPGRFVLVGLSLGAIVGLEMLRRAPERIAGLCLMSTNAAAPRPEQYADWRELDALIEDGRFAEAVERTLPGMFDLPRPPAPLARRYREMARAVGPVAARAQLAAQATRTDAFDALRAARCPATVLYGEADALCPPDFHRAIAEALPAARLRGLHGLPGAGHLLPWQRPEAVGAALRGLLAASPGNDVHPARPTTES